MGAQDWETYLWELLPRPYKVLSERERERDPTEARKFINAMSVEIQRVQDMVEDIRANWLIPSMDSSLLDTKGWERGKLTRWAGESDDEFRLRVLHAFDWFALGGTAAGMKKILELLGYRNVSITERVTEDQWAEFGVNVALASGDVLVTENIERVKRIVNEIKAAHTRLVSTNVQYDPPDIGLDPDHIHRYDWCYYDLGLWPRPVERWGALESVENIIRAFTRSDHLTRMIMSLAPTYDDTRYDIAFEQIWKLHQYRRHYGSTDRLVRLRKWSDGGGWTGCWNDTIVEKSANGPGKRITTAYSMGVYDASLYGSLNSAYAPRYCYVAHMGEYGDAAYDEYIGETGYRPIYRYYARVWRDDITLPEARSSKHMRLKVSYPILVLASVQSRSLDGRYSLNARYVPHDVCLDGTRPTTDREWRSKTDGGEPKTASKANSEAIVSLDVSKESFNRPKQTSAHIGHADMITEGPTWRVGKWDDSAWNTINRDICRTMQAAVIRRMEGDV